MCRLISDVRVAVLGVTPSDRDLRVVYVGLLRPGQSLHQVTTTRPQDMKEGIWIALALDCMHHVRTWRCTLVNNNCAMQRCAKHPAIRAV